MSQRAGFAASVRRGLQASGLAAVVVLGLTLAGPLVPLQAQEAVPAGGSGAHLGLFHPLAPQRLLDTRTGLGAPLRELGPGETMVVAVAGRGGVPATGASAVTVNITVTGTETSGYLTVFPSGSRRPTASTLNYAPGDTVANLTVSALSTDGRIAIYNSSGRVHVLMDLAGWYDDHAPLSTAHVAHGGSRVIPTAPRRILDTRSGVGGRVGPLGPSSILTIAVAGRGGVPSSGVSAVVLNLTATSGTRPTFVTAFPAAQTVPRASNLNVRAGETRANQVVVRLGTGGVALFNSAGSLHLIADVVGYLDLNVSSGNGDGHVAARTPVRVLDTRTANGGHARAVAAGESFALPVLGRGGVPTSGVSAVLVNLTATAPTAVTYITVFPTGVARPVASSLNVSAGRTVPNAILAKVGTGGRIQLYNAAGKVHLIVDVVGYVTSSGPAVPTYTAVKPPGSTATSPSSVSPDTATQKRNPAAARMTPAQAKNFWTPERMASARPIGLLERGKGARNSFTAVEQPQYGIYDENYLAGANYSAAVGRIYAVIDGEAIGECSGTVVARNLVLTAAHCVSLGDVRLTDFVFVPGQIAAQAPYGNWYNDLSDYYPAYDDSSLNKWDVGAPFYPLDYALLRIAPQNGRYIGDVTGFFPIAWDVPDGVKFSEGYPAEGSYFSPNCSGNSCFVYYCHSPVGAYATHYPSWHEVGFGCHISGGHSGGPIFQFVNGSWHVTSVNSNGPTLLVDPDGQRRSSKNLWGPYFNSWVYDLWNYYAVR